MVRMCPPGDLLRDEGTGRREKQKVLDTKFWMLDTGDILKIQSFNYVPLKRVLKRIP